MTEAAASLQKWPRCTRCSRAAPVFFAFDLNKNERYCGHCWPIEKADAQARVIREEIRRAAPIDV